METAGREPSASRPATAPPRWLEGAGVLALAALTGFFLATSWRKWTDPLLDFGKELYVPWRLGQGALLYRDVDDYYGPLSQYANAGLFAAFGPGLMVLVAANLCVFAAILFLLYRLFRRAWGAGAAFVASGLFISVFAFSESVLVGNYNYATPYAHESTHGFLVCLALVTLLPDWIGRVSSGRAFAAGLLGGLTAVLKPEFMVAAAALVLAAVALKRRAVRLRPGEAWALVAGAVLPTAAFALYFSTRIPPWPALRLACRGWINVTASTRFTADPVQLSFLGFDQPWRHLGEHVRATALAAAALAAVAGGAWGIDRLARRGARLAALGVAVAGAAAAGCWLVDWFEVGRCLLGLAAIHLAIQAVAWRRAVPGSFGAAQALRLLLALLAVVLMGRMVLNGRVYQFGFYQAAVAAMLVPAVMIREMPERLTAGRWGRMLAAACVVGLLVPGVIQLAVHSQHTLARKTHPVGSGRDLFYSLVPEVNPTGDIVAQTAAWLVAAKRPGQTLLVLPEGEMINYLARLPSPVAPFAFFSAATRGDREAGIVRDLERHPPDWVAIVSRDLHEYGLRRYGEQPDQGGQILAWVNAHYEPAAELGGDPLDDRERGAVILQRKP